MSIRAKAFFAILLVIGCAVAYKVRGVSQGDGAKALVRKTVSLPPLPPGYTPTKAVIVPPKPYTNTFTISWTNPKSTATASVFMATSPKGPWKLVAKTNVPPVRVKTTNAFALFRASFT